MKRILKPWARKWGIISLMIPAPNSINMLGLSQQMSQERSSLRLTWEKKGQIEKPFQLGLLKPKFCLNSLIINPIVNKESLCIRQNSNKKIFKSSDYQLLKKSITTKNKLSLILYFKPIWSKKIKTVKGYAFSQPARIYAQNDSVLWVSDTHSSKRTLVKMLVHKGEIRE